MTSIIKIEVEHLRHKANEIRAKIEELMSRSEDPSYEEKIGGLNAMLDNVISEITLNENELSQKK